MSKIIIPQANSVSPVLIKASHWQKYLGDIVANYILSGLGLSAGAGLNVSVAAGRGYIGGIDFESDATDTVAVVGNTTNYIFAQLTFDGASEPNGWQYVVNQTGTPPSNSILLGTATTNASAVTGTSTSGTQQGLALDNFAVNQIGAVQGQTAVNFVNNIAIASNKITTSQSHQIYSVFDASFGYALIFDQQIAGQNPSYIFRSALTQIPGIQIHRGADFTNYERIFLGYNGGGSKWLFSVSNGGTGVIRPLDLQMGGNSIITLNTDNSVNANSRLWNNFKLGNQMDANGQNIANALLSSPIISGTVLVASPDNSVYSAAVAIRKDAANLESNTFALHNEDVGANAGVRILGVTKTSDGSLTRTIGYIYMDSTAKVATQVQNGKLGIFLDNNSGTPTEYFNILGGATGLATFFANVSIGANKLTGVAGGFTNGLYAKSTDGRVWVMRTETATNNYTALQIMPIGIGASSLRADLEIWGTDGIADSINKEVLVIKASDNAGTPSGYAIDVTKSGAGSLRTLTMRMNGNDIITLNTDNSVNANSRLWNNFKLGNLMDGGGQKIFNVATIYMSSTAGDDPGTGFLAGLRNANLGLLAAADGATAREIILYTQNAITAGVANGVARLEIGAGAAQGSSFIKAFEPFDFESYVDRKVISAPADPATGYVRLYPKATDANNDDLYVKHKFNSTVVEDLVLTQIGRLNRVDYENFSILKATMFNDVIGSGTITDGGFGSELGVTISTGGGTGAQDGGDVYIAGYPLDWSKNLELYWRASVSSMFETDVAFGINIETRYNLTDNTKKIGIEMADTSSNTTPKAFNVVSADGTTRSTTATTFSTNGMNNHRLSYTPTSLKYYANGVLQATKTTNLPATGTVSRNTHSFHARCRMVTGATSTSNAVVLANLKIQGYFGETI